MTKDEVLESLAGLVDELFRDKARAWAFEIRDHDLHAVCVRYPSRDLFPDVIAWIELRLGSRLATASNPQMFFLPGGLDQMAVLIVKAPSVTDAVTAELELKTSVARRRCPVLVLHRPAQVLN